MTTPTLTKGLLAACAILVIWSGFIVFSRAGMLFLPSALGDVSLQTVALG